MADPEHTDFDGFTRHYEPIAGSLRAWAELRCRGPLGRAVDRDDLVQEVCLEAIFAFDRYDPDRGPFRSWLFGVANRVASNQLRRLTRGRGNRDETNLSSRAHQLPAAVTTISRRVRRDEYLSDFLKHMDELEDDEKLLLLHRGLEGLDHRAVGEILGLAADVAAKRWQRLRDRVRTWPVANDLLIDT